MIHIERAMTHEEKRLFGADTAEHFGIGEVKKIVEFAEKHGYLSRTDEFGIGINMSNVDYTVRISLENYTHPEKTIGANEQRFYADPITFDEKMQQWKKLFYLPGVPENQVRASIVSGHLRVSSPAYVDESSIPRGIIELVQPKKISDGIYEVILR